MGRCSARVGKRGSADHVSESFHELDLGEREAISLAKEMRADLILLDDKVARRTALRESMKVKGTLGILAAAAKANLLDF